MANNVPLFSWHSSLGYVIVDPQNTKITTENYASVADIAVSPELRKLIHGLIEEFDHLQIRISGMTRKQKLLNPESGTSEKIEEIIRTSDSYLRLLDKCMKESLCNYVEQQGSDVIFMLPDVISIMTLCGVFLSTDEAAVSPRVFWWLRSSCLDQPFIQDSFASLAMNRCLQDPTTNEWNELLLHFLFLGELEAAAELLISRAKHALASHASGKDALGRLALLLGERLNALPFTAPSELNMSRVVLPNNIRDQWRQNIIEVTRSEELIHALGPEYCRKLEGVLTGSESTLFQVVANSNPQYDTSKWALLLASQILYSDLITGGKHSIGARLDQMAPERSIMGDDLKDRAKLSSLKHIVCSAEGANVAMAIKLLYEMNGPLARVCAALVADLCTHSAALEAAPLQGQDCGVRERLLIEVAEFTESSLPQGWRLAAQVLRHCPVHGRHALGLILLRLPVALPHTPEVVVRDAIRWCDVGFSPPLNSVKTTICAARAALFARQNRHGAATEMLLLSGDETSLRAQCKKIFDVASQAIETLLVAYGNKSSEEVEACLGGVLYEHRSLEAIVAALTRFEANESSSELQGDVSFITEYFSLVDQLVNSPAKWNQETVDSIGQTLAVAPLGAKPHLLKVVLMIQTHFSESVLPFFNSALLENIMVALEEVTAHHSQDSGQFTQEEVTQLRLLLTTSLAVTFISFNTDSAEKTAPQPVPQDAPSIRIRPTSKRIEQKINHAMFTLSAADLLDLPPLIS